MGSSRRYQAPALSAGPGVIRSGATVSSDKLDAAGFVDRDAWFSGHAASDRHDEGDAASIFCSGRALRG